MYVWAYVMSLGILTLTVLCYLDVDLVPYSTKQLVY